MLLRVDRRWRSRSFPNTPCTCHQLATCPRRGQHLPASDGSSEPAALQLPCCPGRTLPCYRLATHFVRSQVLQGRLCHLGTHTFDSFYTGRAASSCRGRAALGGPCGPPHALHCSSNQILLQISCLAFPEDIVSVITLFYQEVGKGAANFHERVACHCDSAEGRQASLVLAGQNILTIKMFSTRNHLLG